MRPTLRQIEYFVAVADLGGFGAAAEALAVSQPSLSKQLATMEAELGVTLFERTTRRVTLTPVGRSLVPRGREILQQVRDFRNLAQGSAHLFGDRLSLGVLPSVGAYFMPLVAKRLSRIYPDLRLSVQEGSNADLLDSLRGGQLDAVIGTPSTGGGFASIPLFSESLWICASGDDPISISTEPVQLADLAGRSFLALGAGFQLTEVVERLAAEAGAFVSQDYQGSSLDAVRQMAVMGAGVAVLPSLYALAEAIRDPNFVVRRIDHPLATHQIVLLTRPNAPYQDDFQQLAKDMIAVKMEIRASRDARFQ